MNPVYALAAILALIFTSCVSAPSRMTTQGGETLRESGETNETQAEDGETSVVPEISPGERADFREIWGYLVADREQTLKASYPLSDVGYFGAEVDAYGQLVQVPDPQKLSFFKGRVHLVVACNGRALTHFVLEPGSAVRKQLIADLLQAAEAFDGLQIDFENVPARDGEVFLSFLGELQRGLGDKAFTIALPARTRRLEGDVYDYQRILPTVDRILVMAYDEHWSTSEPGPIASMDWSQRVAAYALETVGAEKLIMGLPFYGRAWGDKNVNRAYLHSGIERLIQEQGVAEIRREQGIPTFQYETPVTVTVYYEDFESLASRLKMYRSMGAQAVGFWSLGQETALIWDYLQLSGDSAKP